MDRQLEKKTWSWGRIALLVGIVVLLLTVFRMVDFSDTTQLRVDASRITVSAVENGEFREYYPFDGTVEPTVSVYLDVEEGGRVDEILIEGGQFVRKGDLIMRISNAALQRSAIDSETQLLENLDRLRNTQFNRAQSQLLLREQLLDMEYEIQQLEKKHERYKVLNQQQGLLTQEQFESVSDELVYLKQRKKLLEERIRQEDLLSEQQVEQANQAIERLTTSLELLAGIVDSLEVRAPISGYLSSINASLGESIARGQRIGQIDLLDEFKLRLSIDQYYIASVDVDTVGHLRLGGERLEVRVGKIYTEVTDNAFAVDMEFTGGQPEGLRRGQTLTVELSFSEAEQSLMVSKGGFYQQTGGRWVYLLAEDGRSAQRTNIRLGRQNPRYVEVLEGLQRGDRIITSGYDTYNEADELLFEEAI